MSKESRNFEVNSLEDLYSKVRSARSILDLRDGEELWYRGVSSKRHRLLPSLQRCLPETKRTAQAIRSLESDLFFEFLAKARTNDRASLDHWDVLFLMQHYRAPTRLLDWTEVLYVALYFAVAYRTDTDEEPPRIYILNPYRWNEAHDYGRDLVWPRYLGYDKPKDYFYEYGEILTDDELDWKHPVALYPPQREARLSAQRGFFTIHGTDARPLDEIAPRSVVAIDLGSQAIGPIKDALEYSGVDEYALFPDLEGLSRQLRKKYRLPGK